MFKRSLTIITFVLLLSLTALAADKKPAAKSSGGPDKAYVQKIWDGWAGLDASKVAQYYAPGPRTFFDIAPLKYSSWEEYQAGVANILGEYKSATLTINDDFQSHNLGNTAWCTATVKADMVKKNDKREMSTYRWTGVFEKQKDGKWLIVHEHVSQPIQ